MAFIKVQKNKAYYKRFQVKYRRRREGKTDYYARKRLCTQDKNKYNTPKYRFVVRRTNTDVIAQIIYPKIVGDVVVAAAYAHELPRYGIQVGLTNYSAAYATGLLLARRHLAKVGLADKYAGNTKNAGEAFHVEPLADGPRPFRALLDVGLARTTTGSRIFAALKGAVDGGLDIPHSERRFAGYDAEETKLDPAVLRKYIFGGHVADWMRKLQEQDSSKYDKVFSRYVKAGVTADKLEDVYKNAHAAIRKSPEAQNKNKPKPANAKHHGHRRITLAERRNRVNQLVANHKKAAASGGAAGAADDE